MGLLDKLKKPRLRCMHCNAKIPEIIADTPIDEIGDAAMDGTLPHKCRKCGEVFCLKCVISSPVQASRSDPDRPLLVADIMAGDVAFICPNCGAGEAKVLHLNK